MDAPSASRTATACPVRSPCPALRVLIVNNQATAARNLQRQLLCQTKHRVAAIECTAHGLEALASAEVLQPTLAIIELSGPRRSATCTARSLRARPWAHSIVIVSHGGSAHSNDLDEAHFDFHFVQDFAADLLLQIYPSLARRAAITSRHTSLAGDKILHVRAS